MAAGTIKPVMYAGFVRLVRDDGLALWKEMTGKELPPFTGMAPPKALPRTAEAMCKRRRMQGKAKPRTCHYPQCDEAPRPYENGTLWLCPGQAWHHYVIARTPAQRDAPALK
jgi:hypothetical protein